MTDMHTPKFHIKVLYGSVELKELPTCTDANGNMQLGGHEKITRSEDGTITERKYCPPLVKIIYHN